VDQIGGEDYASATQTGPGNNAITIIQNDTNDRATAVQNGSHNTAWIGQK
jgi:hypothetical protein